MRNNEEEANFIINILKRLQHLEYKIDVLENENVEIWKILKNP